MKGELPILRRVRSGFFRLFFHLLYHQFAWSYDWVAAFVSVGMWKDWVLSVLPYINGQSVFEIGFGTGHLQKSLKERGLNSVGIDISPQMIRIARDRLINGGYEPVIIHGSARNLPLNNAGFDTVVATFPSEYFFETSNLLEIRRILQPEGKLVVLPAAWITGNSWIHMVAAWLFQITGQSPKFEVSFNDSLKSTFLNAGFDVKLIKKTVRSSFVIIIVAHLGEGQQWNF